ncbi:MAG TPA: magnesium transporter, partial [Chloroflexi bacterium]|nr:magnesium transporter [Chloroflexota bacterium]
MERTQIANLTEQVRRYLESDDLEGAIALLEALRPADKAEVFGDLPPSRQQHLLPRLDAEESADILEKLEDEEVAELAGRLEPRTLGRILDAMEPDEAADLLGDLPTQKAQALLASMKEAEEVRPLLLHPDDTAGGLMTSEFLALKRKMSAREALEAVRRWAPETEAAHYLFVVDTRNKLCGVVSLRQLIIVDPTTRLEEIMDPDVIQVKVGTDREECAQIMSRYDITALPVVDEEERLLGVITIDDILDVLEEEATEDIQRLGGAQPLEKPYLSTGIFEVSKKRMGWLLVLFVTETLTGSVLRHFQTQLDAVVALAFFVPLLIGTGGNAGTQTTSTIIRALAVG